MNDNKKFWQRFAKLYTAFMAKNDKAYDKACDILWHYTDKKMQVLELACGTGQITFRMAKEVRQWYATDYSENMIQEAEKRWQNRKTDPSGGSGGDLGQHRRFYPDLCSLRPSYTRGSGST